MDACHSPEKKFRLFLRVPNNPAIWFSGNFDFLLCFRKNIWIRPFLKMCDFEKIISIISSIFEKIISQNIIFSFFEKIKIKKIILIFSKFRNTEKIIWNYFLVFWENNFRKYYFLIFWEKKIIIFYFLAKIEKIIPKIFLAEIMLAHLWSNEKHRLSCIVKIIISYKHCWFSSNQKWHIEIFVSERFFTLILIGVCIHCPDFMLPCPCSGPYLSDHLHIPWCRPWRYVSFNLVKANVVHLKMVNKT